MAVEEAILKDIIKREKQEDPHQQNYRGRRGRYEQADKKQYQCYNCKRYRHFSYECYSRPHSRVAEKSNLTLEEELKANSTIILTYKGEENTQENILYLDSGASNHICGIKEIFKS